MAPLACGSATTTSRRPTGSGGPTIASGWSGRPGRPPGADRSAGELRGEPDVVVGDGAAVGQQLAVVVEQHDAVAQQAPALLGVAAHHGGEVTRLAGGVGAGLRVVAHGGSIRSDRGTVP